MFVDTAPETGPVASVKDTLALRPVVAPKRIPMDLGSVYAPARVLGEVSGRFGVSVAEILSKDRHKSIARARHVAAWLLRQTGMSYPEIGRALGKRDHTTAMASVERVEAGLAAEPQWRPTLEAMLRVATSSALRLVAGEGAVFDDYETATGSIAADTSSSASSARSQAEGSLA